MKRFAQLLVLVATISLLSANANADVVYHLTALTNFNNSDTADVTLTTANFISSGFIILNASDPAVTCNLTGPACLSVFFNADYPGHDQISFSTTTYGEAYYFADGAFGAYGTYNEDLCNFDCTGRHAILTVSESATPEPGSLFLLGSGLLGVGGAVRRKLIA